MRLLLTIGLLCSALAATNEGGPERRVQANVLTSERDPKIKIELPKSVQYVGADRWVLFGIADCELHIFVEADTRKQLQHLYWLQFEGYIPSRPELQHTYPMTRTETIAGMLFDVRARFGSSSDKPKPGSDLEHVHTLLQSKGYKLPEGTMNVRLVHLLDKQMRQELMIIYSEDLKPTGFTVGDLMPGGRGASQWPQMANELIERAKKAITLRRN